MCAFFFTEQKKLNSFPNPEVPARLNTVRTGVTQQAMPKAVKEDLKKIFLHSLINTRKIMADCKA
jgi:hypothetical protein